MGTLTLGDGTDNFRARVSQRIHDRDEFDSSTPDGARRLDEVINSAYEHISLPNIHSHPELKTDGTIALSTNVRSYTLTALSSFWATRHVVYEGTGGAAGRTRRVLPESITRMTTRTFDTTNFQPAGRPNRYTIDGDRLIVDKYPTADENGINLRVYYWRTVATLSATSAVTLVRAAWDKVIVEGAAFYGWLSLGQAERADFFRDTFARLIAEIGENEAIEAMDDGWRSQTELGIGAGPDYMGL